MTSAAKKQATPAKTSATPAPTKALTKTQVRRLLVEGREIRRELERRIEKMHRVDPADAAARAR